MGHDHAHGNGAASYGRAFAIGIALNFGFVLIEFFYGRIAHSLALVADACHNLSDVLSLILAWGAGVLSLRHPTADRTYGMRRSSILAALINAVVLLIGLGAMAWEAIGHLASPAPVAAGTVMWVSAIGIGVNAITAFLFASGRKGDLNIRGAFLHMAADAVISLAVVISGAVILYTGWNLLDPVVSLGIIVVIFIGTWGLLRDSLNLALDAVPENITIADVERYLCSLPKVLEVHDLHIWGMSTTEAALTTHLVMAEPVCDNKFLLAIEHELHKRFGIEHATVQVEVDDIAHSCSCRLARSPISIPEGTKEQLEHY